MLKGIKLVVKSVGIDRQPGTHNRLKSYHEKKLIKQFQICSCFYDQSIWNGQKHNIHKRYINSIYPFVQSLNVLVWSISVLFPSRFQLYPYSLLYSKYKLHHSDLIFRYNILSSSVKEDFYSSDLSVNSKGVSITRLSHVAQIVCFIWVFLINHWGEMMLL